MKAVSRNRAKNFFIFNILMISKEAEIIVTVLEDIFNVKIILQNCALA